MAENNNVQNVKIVTSEINLRATSLRARLTDVVAMYKSTEATRSEREEALARLDEAYAQFKMELRGKVVIA